MPNSVYPFLAFDPTMETIRYDEYLDEVNVEDEREGDRYLSEKHKSARRRSEREAILWNELRRRREEMAEKRSREKRNLRSGIASLSMNEIQARVLVMLASANEEDLEKVRKMIEGGILKTNKQLSSTLKKSSATAKKIGRFSMFKDMGKSLAIEKMMDEYVSYRALKTTASESKKMLSAGDRIWGEAEKRVKEKSKCIDDRVEKLREELASESGLSQELLRESELFDTEDNEADESDPQRKKSRRFA